MKDQKFKVGDNCKVIQRLHGHDFLIGEQVIIKECYPNGKPPHYLCKNHNAFWYLQDDELEQIQPEQNN